LKVLAKPTWNDRKQVANIPKVGPLIRSMW
uniref:Reverse transcriptase n=1 Tax=Brugia timori TaxID=42155 RepID=A0A0R3R730_9BILA